ncbi:MarR family winged helix-turn-helix transcriptional regulator [Nocardioides luteus]|uniref:MarR family winged helix-turn-helix transcriptional regulator n=1 Tax=Nocardioides luteus TaxID=1844 RepID=UPI0018C9DB39|nr:MarR family transcriptional regulator [Nocardioides luteus]MBG6096333.1 DNA-binding MarR family transcriptional regulator [Nocardioides luteus]
MPGLRNRNQRHRSLGRGTRNHSAGQDRTVILLERRLSSADLGAGEAVLLLALERGPLTMTGVMSTLHIKASTATSLVNRLETLGLVHRSPNPEDRRSLLVDLTDTGLIRASQVRPTFEDLDAALTGSDQQPTLSGIRHALQQASLSG